MLLVLKVQAIKLFRERQILASRRRFTATNAPNTEESFAPKVVSKRQQFRMIQPDYTILDKLDKIQLGFNSKRRQRVAVAKKFGNLKNRPPQFEKLSLSQKLKLMRKEAPYPFKKLGIPLVRAHTYDEIPRVFPGNDLPVEVAVIGRSNVGKSTLLNALLSFDESYIQKASVSFKPGETTDLQFFGLGIHPIKPENITIEMTQSLKYLASIEEKELRKRRNIANKNNIQHHQAMESKKKKEVKSSKIDENSKVYEDNDDYYDENNSGSFNKKWERELKNKRHEGSAMILVDMPGYGFSFMKEEEKLRIRLLCSKYLRERGSTLKRVILLLDGRHGLKFGDKLFFKQLIEGNVEYDYSQFMNESTMNLNDENVQKEIQDKIYQEMIKQNKKINKENIHWKLQVVLTKCDLLDRAELARRIQVVQDTLSETLPGFGNMLSVIALSGKYGNGVNELRKELASLVVCPPQWNTSNIALGLPPKVPPQVMFKKKTNPSLHDEDDEDEDDGNIDEYKTASKKDISSRKSDNKVYIKDMDYRERSVSGRRVWTDLSQFDDSATDSRNTNNYNNDNNDDDCASNDSRYASDLAISSSSKNSSSINPNKTYIGRHLMPYLKEHEGSTDLPSIRKFMKNNAIGMNQDNLTINGRNKKPRWKDIGKTDTINRKNPIIIRGDGDEIDYIVDADIEDVSLHKEYILKKGQQIISIEDETSKLKYLEERNKNKNKLFQRENDDDKDVDDYGRYTPLHLRMKETITWGDKLSIHNQRQPKSRDQIPREDRSSYSSNRMNEKYSRNTDRQSRYKNDENYDFDNYQYMNRNKDNDHSKDKYSKTTSRNTSRNTGVSSNNIKREQQYTHTQSPSDYRDPISTDVENNYDKFNDDNYNDYDNDNTSSNKRSNGRTSSSSNSSNDQSYRRGGRQTHTRTIKRIKKDD